MDATWTDINLQIGELFGAERVYQAEVLRTMKFLLIALVAGASALSAQQDAPAAPAAAPPVPPKRFLKLDKNHDGRLSLDEFKSLGDPAKREKRFRKLDVNHDGFLSPEEFVAGRKTAK